MKKILFTILLVVVFAAPAFAQMSHMSMMGQGGGHGMMMGQGDMEMPDGGMMCMEHMRQMGLTDEQMEKMKPLRREMQKKHIRFKADEKIAEIELQEIMDVKDFDLEKANAAVQKIGDMKTAHHLEMLKAQKDMRAILTDEQFKKKCKMMPMQMGAKKHGKKMMRKKAPKNPKPQQPVADPKPNAQSGESTHQH